MRQPLAEQPTGADADLRLQGVEARAQRVLARVEEGGDALSLVVADDGDEGERGDDRGGGDEPQDVRGPRAGHDDDGQPDRQEDDRRSEVRLGEDEHHAGTRAMASDVTNTASLPMRS